MDSPWGSLKAIFERKWPANFGEMCLNSHFSPIRDVGARTKTKKKRPGLGGAPLLYFGSSFRNFLEEIDHVRTLDLRCANHHLERPIEQSLLDVSTLDQAASRI